MAGLDISINAIINDRSLKALKQNTEINRRILDGAAAIILQKNRQRFLLAVDPNNIKWTESFQAKRRALGFPDSQGIRDSGRKTLFSTGTLFRSIQVLRAIANSNKRAVGVNPSITNFRSGAKAFSYGLQHQLGKGVDGIRREFIGINSNDVVLIDNFISLEIAKILDGK